MKTQVQFLVKCYCFLLMMQFSPPIYIQVSITSRNKVCLKFVRRSIAAGSTVSLVSSVTTTTTTSSKAGDDVTEIVQVSSNGMDVC